MSERSIRWVMHVTADVPLTPCGQPLRRIDARVLEFWLKGKVTLATPAFVRLAKDLMAADDVRDLPKIHTNFLAHQTRLSEATVRGCLRRFANIGRRLTETARQ